ncbi:MAG: lyase family protein [Calditrichaceae bacterium]
MRTEQDALGEIDIPDKSFYGIHSQRAKENFPDRTPFNFLWYRALGTVKLACYKTYEKFINAARQKFPDKNLPIKCIDDSVLKQIMISAEEISSGKYFEHFIIPGISGGAGTSINMNINEIIANSALVRMRKNPGDYEFIHPIEHANIFQSTNDVVPTALKLAVMELLGILEKEINGLRKITEKHEKNYRENLRIAFTQMQAAVPSSYGKLFSTYNNALSRDWWRVSKSFERIKIVNLGGSAVGTGITVPRFFIFEVVQTLKELTGLPVTRSENLSDTTANFDSFVEVHAILKANAVNLEKMVSDLRLLSSDLISQKEMNIPKSQVGSSIMPGKINPVIPEFVISACHKIYANDVLITSLAGQGCLDLNAYLPVVGNALLDSLQLLVDCNSTVSRNLMTGLDINTNLAAEKLLKNPSVTTALVPYLGYKDTEKLAGIMTEHNCDIFEANDQLHLIDTDQLRILMQPDNLLKLGFTIDEIPDNRDKKNDNE